MLLSCGTAGFFSMCNSIEMPFPPSFENCAAGLCYEKYGACVNRFSSVEGVFLQGEYL